jgi:hypothetical protein
MIAGFIIQGSTQKKVLIRARGPSLAVAPFNVPGTLSDPFLTLYSGATPIDTNDDFAQHANSGQIPTDWIPANDLEAAIVTTLYPGAYTAIVSGFGGTTGVAIVEVFELDQPGTPLINIATRGPVYTGDNVMIAGLIIQGDAPKTVLITARGPSMAGPPHNVPGTLSLNHPRHIPTADRAQAHQQQVAAFDCTCEVGNGGFILAFAAPDVGEQQFPCLRWNSGPQLGSSGSELRDLLDVHNV